MTKIKYDHMKSGLRVLVPNLLGEFEEGFIQEWFENAHLKKRERAVVVLPNGYKWEGPISEIRIPEN